MKYNERNQQNNAKLYFCKICNCEIKLKNKLRHETTQKHQNHLKQLEKEPETLENKNFLDNQYQLTECFYAVMSED